MSTSKQWLAEVLKSESKINDWLVRQYVGEFHAAKRVAQLATNIHDLEKKVKIQRIAADESQHAQWVKQLLINRGISTNIDNQESENRYYKNILNKTDPEYLIAAGAHAEKMRLERIRAIVDSVEVAEDIRECFKNILVDEVRHEQDFREMSTQEMYQEALSYHQEGMVALSLEM